MHNYTIWTHHCLCKSLLGRDLTAGQFWSTFVIQSFLLKQLCNRQVLFSNRFGWLSDRDRSGRAWVRVVLSRWFGCLLLLQSYLACRSVRSLKTVIHRLRVVKVYCWFLKTVGSDASHVLTDADLSLSGQRQLARVLLVTKHLLHTHVVRQDQERIPSDGVAASYGVCVLQEDLILLVLIFELSLCSLMERLLFHAETQLLRLLVNNFNKPLLGVWVLLHWNCWLFQILVHHFVTFVIYCFCNLDTLNILLLVVVRAVTQYLLVVWKCGWALPLLDLQRRRGVVLRRLFLLDFVLGDQTFRKLCGTFLDERALKPVLGIRSWTSLGFGSCLLELNGSSSWDIIDLPYIIVWVRKVCFVHLMMRVSNLCSWPLNHPVICKRRFSLFAGSHPVFQQILVLWHVLLILLLMKALWGYSSLFWLNNSCATWILRVDRLRDSCANRAILLRKILGMRLNNLLGWADRSFLVLRQRLLAQSALQWFVLIEARLDICRWHLCIRKRKTAFPTCCSFCSDLLFWSKWSLCHLQNWHLFF